MKRLVGLAMIAALGCGGADSPTSPVSASIAGTYHLTAINGSALPYTYQVGSAKVVITGDVITITDSGTWTESGTFTQTVDGTTTNQVVTDGGPWLRSGTTFALNHSDGSLSYTGRMVGTVMSLADQIFSYTFAR